MAIATNHQIYFSIIEEGGILEETFLGILEAADFLTTIVVEPWWREVSLGDVGHIKTLVITVVWTLIRGRIKKIEKRILQLGSSLINLMILQHLDPEVALVVRKGNDLHGQDQEAGLGHPVLDLNLILGVEVDQGLDRKKLGLNLKVNLDLRIVNQFLLN